MPIDPDAQRELQALIRGGFEDRHRIIEILTEEMYEPGELDAAELEHALDAAIRAHEESKIDWPAITDCDRLDATFDALVQRGIIALQNAGYTQSDGYDDVISEHQEAADPDRFFGYCFFHGQDLARAIEGGGLFLAFGPLEASKEDIEGPRVGELVAEELRRAGFEVRWNGSFQQRIHVPAFDWKRR
ncbi:hypothetical protein ASF11_18840 [Acidovorax sp. Leaf76]|uniref:DUF6891 domain-containing protein n=1 Tax=unclassified Acidovorax TaxID=2684926 RepID=UPI0006F1D737|nr:MULTISPECIES: hypothetical protein [unclassified Acidovorax]KQO25615.1 hypothetical protein ASF11_18840 [Acidovorax sp. Leaf76]KQO29298.1 hypothetical protein ASF19_16505 [Acidovorax sp. Leaf84]KQS25821.1 hypothetical protein ASG27_18885 [Acidovorax sp. Leaf191]